jgi:translation initiation factor IF-2
VPGIKVNKGKILKKYKAYIFKNGIPITEGLSIKFIKCFKKEVVELKEGEEGTICLEEKME